MSEMKRYQWNSAKYATAFTALLRCYGSREPLYAILRDLLRHIGLHDTSRQRRGGDDVFHGIHIGLRGPAHFVEKHGEVSP